jgi:hypothetical protein
MTRPPTEAASRLILATPVGVPLRISSEHTSIDRDRTPGDDKARTSGPNTGRRQPFLLE